ncbi:hypothetical protein BH09BAC5_BH09BAC5_03400 [soil metagenome]
MSQEKILTQTRDHHEVLIRSRLKMQGDSAHHLELVSEWNGVSWYNHSIATNIDMTWFILKDIPGPLTLIVGGIDRAEDHHKLNQLIFEKVQTIICLGSTPWKYFNAWRNQTNFLIHANDLKEAVELAFKLVPDYGKTVLFSPSCPSFDPFDNYKNRGNNFRNLVVDKIATEKKLIK